MFLNDPNTTAVVALSQPNNTNIFVMRLPMDVDETQLRQLFAPYGEVVSSKILVNIDTGASKGIGFVRYAQPAEAARAIAAMNGARLSTSPRGAALYVGYAHTNGISRAVERERVYIRNVPAGVTADVVRSTFAAYGTIEDCRVLDGVAFVRYSTIEGARRAVATASGTKAFGPDSACPVYVRFAENSTAREARLRKTAIKEQHHRRSATNNNIKQVPAKRSDSGSQVRGGESAVPPAPASPLRCAAGSPTLADVNSSATPPPPPPHRHAASSDDSTSSHDDTNSLLSSCSPSSPPTCVTEHMLQQIQQQQALEQQVQLQQQAFCAASAVAAATPTVPTQAPAPTAYVMLVPHQPSMNPVVPQHLQPATVLMAIMAPQ